jgi:hypothetical protein
VSNHSFLSQAELLETELNKTSYLGTRKTKYFQLNKASSEVISAALKELGPGDGWEVKTKFVGEYGEFLSLIQKSSNGEIRETILISPGRMYEGTTTPEDRNRCSISDTVYQK